MMKKIVFILQKMSIHTISLLDYWLICGGKLLTERIADIMGDLLRT